MARATATAWQGLLCWALVSLLPPAALATEQPNGEEIIREALHRHEPQASRCEELTMILTDSHGERSVREVRTFFRPTPAGGANFLLVIDAPPELSGVSLLVRRLDSGKTESSLYLPAFGKELKEEASGGGGQFLDTDFTPLDFLGERPEEYRYLVAEEARIDLIDYWLIEALPLRPEMASQSGYSKRRIFVRKDTWFIARIDYLDLHGHLRKRQTRHDLKRIEGKAWLANMVLMEGISPSHQTLLKRSRRVFADDCAPEERFTAEGIFANPQRAEGRETEEGAGETRPEGAGGP